jgi:hypothetical protein
MNAVSSPRRRPTLLVACICALCPALTWATSYPALSFEEIVARADVVFVGDVVDVRPFVVTTRGETIVKTRVVFSVRDAIWGTTSSLEILEFLGGEVGDLELSVAEMPRFVVGERRVMFSYRKRSINPVVGFVQGALRVQPDAAGVERVLSLERIPVARVEQLGRARALSAEPAMSLRDLRARIVRELEGRRP